MTLAKAWWAWLENFCHFLNIFVAADLAKKRDSRYKEAVCDYGLIYGHEFQEVLMELL